MSESTPSRETIGAQIAGRLEQARTALSEQFQAGNRIPSCFLDDLLDPELARRIYGAFPAPETMVLKKNLGQKKYVAVQMNRYEPLLEEIVYAFQHPRVVRLVSQITGMEALLPDEHLYAGGISLMAAGHFLKPHLDNSHDKDQKLYRALNLLYYVTPDWKEEYGGNLELWDAGPKGAPRTIASRFNRLVLMVTGKRSWHSVSEVRHHGNRCCVSNYYFSPRPIEGDGSYHVTTFRGRPGERIGDALMACDNAVRTAVRKTFGERLFRNPHVYKK
jgi:Rps23 Pro-64 3,4-dihydroxylase Tpa1-like proline 4-hydroxylase